MTKNKNNIYIYIYFKKVSIIFVIVNIILRYFLRAHTY